MANESTRDAALILLHECGEEIAGKTAFQKLAYFLGVKEGLDFGFEPHFYGPFSRNLEQEVELLLLSELVREETTVLGTSRGGAPISNTRYELTEEGRREAERLVDAHAEQAKNARAIADILRASHALSTRRVSLAAKIHFVIQSQNLPMTSHEIAAKSRELGWQIDTGDIEAASEVLDGLGLVGSVNV